MRKIQPQPKVSVIIPTQNRKNSLNQTLKSLFKMNYPRKKLEVVVIDNGSKDQTGDFVRLSFPEVKLIQNNHNIGFAPALNLGIKQSNGRYVLITNDDVLFDKESLSELVKIIEKDKTIGIVGGKMLLSDKKTMALPGFRVNLWLGYHPYDFSNSDMAREMDVATGGCMLVRKSIFKKIGFYDEGFFFCGEDYDLCLRAKKAGFKIFYSPTATIYHKLLSASKKTDNFDQLFAHYRGKFRFMLIHGSIPQIFVFFLLQLFIGPLFTYFQSKQKTLLPMLAGIFWNIHHLKGALDSRTKVKLLTKNYGYK